MSFADDVIEFQRRPPARKLCATGTWVESLDERGQAAFHAYLAAGRPVAALWRMAVKHGCEAGDTRFRVHCRRECCCYSSVEAAA